MGVVPPLGVVLAWCGGGCPRRMAAGAALEEVALDGAAYLAAVEVRAHLGRLLGWQLLLGLALRQGGWPARGRQLQLDSSKLSCTPFLQPSLCKNWFVVVQPTPAAVLLQAAHKALPTQAAWEAVPDFARLAPAGPPARLLARFVRYLAAYLGLAASLCVPGGAWCALAPDAAGAYSMRALRLSVMEGCAYLAPPERVELGAYEFSHAAVIEGEGWAAQLCCRSGYCRDFPCFRHVGFADCLWQAELCV